MVKCTAQEGAGGRGKRRAVGRGRRHRRRGANSLGDHTASGLKEIDINTL